MWCPNVWQGSQLHLFIRHTSYIYIYNPGCNFLYRIRGVDTPKSFDFVEKSCTSILLQNQKPSNTIGQQVPKNPPFWDALPKVPDSVMTLHEGFSVFLILEGNWFSRKNLIIFQGLWFCSGQPPEEIQILDSVVILFSWNHLSLDPSDLDSVVLRDAEMKGLWFCKG